MVLTSTHNLCFEQECENIGFFLFENFQFLEMNFSVYLNRRVFVMLLSVSGERMCTMLVNRFED